MRRLRYPPLPRFVALLLVMDGLWALGFAFHLLVGIESTTIAWHLHPGRESNVPTWYSSTLWMLAAGLFAIYARLPPPTLKGGIRLFLPVAGSVVLSVDEVAQFHEWIGIRSDTLLPGGTREGTIVSGTGIWMLIVLPIAVAAAVWVAHLLADHLRAAPAAARLIAAGGVLFVLGAGVVELTGNFAAGDRPLQLGIQIVEELCEMTGATVVIWGGFELLRVQGVRIRRFPPDSPAGPCSALSNMEGGDGNGSWACLP